MKTLTILTVALMTALAAPTGAARGTLEEQVTGWLNAATVAEIAEVKGIGGVLSRRIADARDASPFTSYADLLAVKGIGKVLAGRIVNHVESIDPD